MTLADIIMLATGIVVIFSLIASYILMDIDDEERNQSSKEEKK